MSLTTPRLARSSAFIAATVIGGLCILLLGMGIQAVLSHDRTEAAMHRLLVEKGSVLISSLESGLRASRRGNLMPRQDFLLEEMSTRPDVRFIAITGPDGLILAHSNPARLGEALNFEDRDMTTQDMEHLDPDENPDWILTTMEGTPVFAVYKQAGTIRIPASREQVGSDGKRIAYMHTIPLSLFIALDPTPLFTAREEDKQRTLLVFVGGIVCVLLSLFAIHWAFKARRSLHGQQAAEALTKRMVLSLPDGLILFDAQGRISHINPIACLWLGKETPPPGSTLDRALPESLDALATRLFAEPFLPDTELELSVREETLPISVRGGPVETENEGRVGSVMILRDLSERKRLEAEIRRKEKLAAVGNLASGVAHEIRNPLSSIKGYATYFGDRFPEGSDDREAARVMVGEVERLNRVITDLLELASPAKIMRRPTDLKLLTEDIARLIRQDAATRRVNIHVEHHPGPQHTEGPSSLPLVDIDPDRLRQVLLNLCLNALDAMPEGGDLTIALTAGDSHMALEVHDTGTGIAPDVLPTIFDPYFTTKGHGTGLGLATVHKIIEAHGGHILAESTPGQGTNFRLFLPIHSDRANLLTLSPLIDASTKKIPS